jgi:alpha-galactosidase
MRFLRFLWCASTMCLMVCPALAQTVPLVKTPPMGWNTWNHFRHAFDDKLIREEADALVASGMKDAGYEYVTLDGGWEGGRDAQGNIIADSSRFPDMKALGDYIHSKGLKFGIYSAPTKQTCDGEMGSFGHEEQDARTFASWGVDYLKYDVCDGETTYLKLEAESPEKAHEYIVGLYTKMHQALQKTGRPIVYSICEYGLDAIWRWGAEAGGNLWRTTGDIHDSYSSISANGFTQAGLSRYGGPGHWNDPDMLEIGNGGMKLVEYQTQMSLWAILAAPLIASNDMRQMTDETRDILLNREVIAVDQDALGKQGDLIRQEGPLELWMKPLQDGSRAVAVFNPGRAEMDFRFSFAEIGLHSQVDVRDLWLHRDLGVKAGEYTVLVPKHGVVMLRISKAR